VTTNDRVRRRGDSAVDAAVSLGGRWSLRLTLSTCMVLLVVLAVAAVFFVQWRAANEATLDLLTDNASLVLDQIETQTRDITNYAVRHVGFVAENIASGRFPTDDRARLAEYIEASLAGEPQVMVALFFDLDLRVLGVYQRPDGSFEVQDRSMHDPLVGVRLLDRGEATETAFWGELIYSPAEGETFVNVWHPVRRGGALIGMFGLAISLAEISDIVSHAADNYGGTGFVLYGDRQLLAHPILVSGHPELSPETPTVPIDRIGDLVLEDLLDRGFVHLQRKHKVGPLVVVPTEVHGREYLAFLRWLDDLGEERWGIGVWFDAEEFISAWQHMRDAAWVAGAAVLVAVLLAMYLGHLVARPVRRMAGAANRIGAFELSDVAELPHSRIAELDEQATAFNRMLTGLRSFETYVPKTLVRQLIHSGDDGAAETRTQELTIMFTDIAGFTSMSEGRSADEVAAFLNEHFEIVGGCIEAEQGTIDKFIGDAVMAFWGAPEQVSEPAVHACTAALAIRTRLARDNADREARGEPAVRMRIGIHCGPVVVGNIGMAGRINYTVVGDAVNTCQRIEAMGKELAADDDAAILISDRVQRQLPARFRCEQVGSFTSLRGRRQEVVLFRLLGADGAAG